MKLFLIFCVSYLAGVHGVALKNKDAKEERPDLKAVQKCVAELNVNAEKYSQFDLDSVLKVTKELADDERTCMAVCSIRNLINDSYLAKQLKGPTNKDTLYNGFMKMINEAFLTGLGEKSTGYGREDAVKKVNKCRTQESTECGFFKCVGLHEGPMKVVSDHYIRYNMFLEIAHNGF